MVGRILKIIPIVLGLLVCSALTSLAQSNAAQVRMLVSSSVYVSGDLVALHLVALDFEGKPNMEGSLINLYLVAYDGSTVSIERFNSNDQKSDQAFLLPAELRTGNYKLIAHIPGSNQQTEAIIHVYSPTIFSSTALPQNANPELGVQESKASATEEKSYWKVYENSFRIAAESQDAGMLAVKVFDPSLEGFPVRGTVRKSEIAVKNSGSFQLNTPSRDPSSRISVFFLDQGLVEEYILRDSVSIEEKLLQHQGSSSIWAYQFDNMGEAIGEVDVKISDWKSNQFSAFDNTVPFDDAVVTILDHKRKRKYIDQIYRTDFDNYEFLIQKSDQVAPDQVYFSKDYEGIATLREAFSGIISKVSVKRNKDGYELSLSPATSGFKYEKSPFILFNGSPIFDLGDLIETPFHQVYSVSVYNSFQSLKRFGVLGRFGVVSIEMKPEFEDPLGAKKDDYPYYLGINDLVQIKSEVTDPTAPDLRSVLLWTSEEIVTSDLPQTLDWKFSDVKNKHIIWADLLRSDGTSVQWSQPLPAQSAQ
ncbi:hypothetical protein SAMN04489724_2748 [Algoriphagus locisalis]|uniref:MG2 domain-containing protein n=1 Tax=Algoriphagus locisalis TaxID=305507 RepID=A0A1I7BV82_9BACT|nr:hypothetical protein [Algoriphagus locisalis]SFT91104.1 hypothetical protein SAMN04489724_2748 [Algoriphagus locisalis]